MQFRTCLVEQPAQKKNSIYALLLNLAMGICAYRVGKTPKAALTAAIVVLVAAHVVATLLNPANFLTTLPLKAIVVVLLLMARNAVDRINMIDFEVAQMEYNKE